MSKKKCIQCDAKITHATLSKMKTHCVNGITVTNLYDMPVRSYLCKECTKCSECRNISNHRPIEHLEWSDTMITRIEEDRSGEQIAILSRVRFKPKHTTICISLPYNCLHCMPCRICKRGGRFGKKKKAFHGHCFFTMLCWQNNTVFSIFPRDIIKYLLK
jgi:hypothetical protein